jgi:hypothetical protein
VGLSENRRTVAEWRAILELEAILAGKCPIHPSSDLVPGPIVTWSAEGFPYFMSIRCTEGLELYAAESIPPPFIPVTEEEPADWAV